MWFNEALWFEETHYCEDCININVFAKSLCGLELESIRVGWTDKKSVFRMRVTAAHLETLFRLKAYIFLKILYNSMPALKKADFFKRPIEASEFTWSRRNLWLLLRLRPWRHDWPIHQATNDKPSSESGGWSNARCNLANGKLRQQFTQKYHSQNYL